MKTSTTYRESVHLLEVRGAIKAIGLLFMAFILNTTSANAQCTISSTSSASPTTCGGSTGTITLNGLAANTTYSFNYAKNGVTQTPVNVTTNASGVLVKTALASATYSNIFVTKTGCTSSTVGPITVSDPAAPVIASTSSTGPTTCGGSSGTITLNGLLASTNYTFNYSKNGVVQTSSTIASNASGQVIKTALAAGTYSNISVTINNCTSATVGPITLSNPTPPSISASNNGPVCQTGTLNLSATTVTGATYSWSGPSGYTSTSQNPSRTNVATTAGGTYSVTATLNNCTSTPVTTTVVVNPKPATPTTTSNSPVCTGSNILLTASSVTSGVTYSWSGPNGYTSTSQNPTISGVTSLQAGTYTVNAIANGCSSNSATRAVTINATPAISSSSSTDPTSCGGTQGTIVLNGLAASTTYTVNYYKNGVAGASQNITSTAGGVVTKTGLSAGTFSSVTVTRSSCVSSAVGPFTLTDPSLPTASASNNGPICQSTTLSLAAATVTGATYRWNGPNGYTTTTQNPTRTNSSTTYSGVYTLTVTKSSCVSAPSTTTVTVNPTPVTPTASSNTPVCTGTNLNLTASSTTPGVTYTWTGPNSFTSSSQNPTISAVTTSAAGTYTVKATANGCNSANATTAVTVNTTPAITSSSSVSPTTCSGTNGTITLNGLTASSTFTINYTKNGVAGTPTNFNSNASGVLVVSTLSAGSYTNITATRNSCSSNTVSGPLTLSDPAPPAISSTGSVNPSSCGAANGSITLNGLLASTTYTVNYTKNGIAITPVSKTSNVSGVISLTSLTAGIYDNITVTRSSCTSSPVGPINLTGTPVFTTTNSGPTTCSGSDGVVNLNGLIPSTSYAVNYKKNGVAQTTLNLTSNSSGVASITGLISASYSNINVTLSGCTSADAATITLTDPPTPSITSISGSNPTTCSGVDGTITLGGLTASTAYTVNYSKSGIPQSALPVTSNLDGNIIMSFSAGAYSSFNVTRVNCTSNNIGPVTLTDPAAPVVTAGNNGPLCVGGTLNLTSSSNLGGVTYSWSGPNGFTSTSQNPTVNNVAFTDSGSYSVTATLNNCVSTPVSTTLVINTPGAPTASNSGTTCEGLPVTFTASNVSGASYNWSGPNGFTSTSQNPTISSITTSGAGTYSVTATYAGCTSAAGTTALTVNPGFSVAISGTTTLCAGLNTDINFTSGPANATVIYTANGVSQSISLDGTGAASFNTSTLAHTITYNVVSVDNGSCLLPNSNSAVVTVTPNSWNGTADADWNNATNWCGGVPTATTPVLIPSGTPNNPVLPVGLSVSNENLSVASGASITVSGGSTLDVSGSAAINGTISGDGSVRLVGSSTQTITGTGTVSNLNLNNTAGATISVGSTVNVTGVVTLTAGQLTTNGGLVLVSDATGTGSIGTIASGTISGNVVQQRYIPGGKRLYRFFSHPYRDTVALNPELTSQIDVTGFGGAANGFTATQTNNASAFWYNPLTGNTNPGGNGNDPGWTAYTSANATSGANGWKPFQGIRVLVRGAKGEGLLGQTYTPSASTLAMTGAVNTGNVNIPVVKGTNSGFNVLGNPYPSAVNIGGILYAAKQAGTLSGSAYWVWDPNAGTSGAYVTQAISSSSDYYNLPSGGAFVVNAAANGTLAFHESDKVATGAGLFKTTSGGPQNRIEFKVYSNNDSIYWDRMFVSMNDSATNGLDEFDGTKANNPGVNFYCMSTDNVKLSIDARPFVNNMMIPMGFKGTPNQYKIKIPSFNVPANVQLYIIDNYLNIVQPMQLGSEYVFNITNDTASQGDGRFYLNATLINSNPVTSVTTTTDKNVSLKVSIAPNPAVDATNISFEGVQSGNSVSVSITNVNGQEVYNVQVKETANGKVNVPLQYLSSGVYMVKVTSGNETVTKQLVKN